MGYFPTPTNTRLDIKEMIIMNVFMLKTGSIFYALANMDSDQEIVFSFLNSAPGDKASM